MNTLVIYIQLMTPMTIMTRKTVTNYQTIAFKAENVEDEIEEPEEVDLEIDKNLDIPTVTDEE